MIDSGSDVCVLPYTPRKKISSDIKLFSANGSQIHTYGTRIVTLDLNLRRCFTWPFILAGVSKPIIGADFLNHYGLLVDIKNRCLRDPKTSLTTKGQCAKDIEPQVTLVSGDFKYKQILEKFPEILKPYPSNQQVPHNTVHGIETTG